MNDRVNVYQSNAPAATLVRARLGLFLLEDAGLVVEGHRTRGAKDRLAQPLQPEREEQEADHQAQRVERDQRQRRAEGGDDRCQRCQRDCDPETGRPPPARDPDREHDRERLDHLDGAGCERGRDEDDGVHSAERIDAGAARAPNLARFHPR